MPAKQNELLNLFIFLGDETWCSARKLSSERRSVLLYVIERTSEADEAMYCVSTPSYYGEFDPGSGRTLAACLIHASRANDEEACFF